MKIARDFFRSKTTWTGVLAIVAAIASYYAGKETFSQAEQQILAALGAMFLRDAIVKGPGA